MTQYAEAFKRPFTDFTKLLIGILLMIVPIINFFALGYLLECVRTASKKQFEMPTWENWGDLFVNGFFSVIISILYLIPALLAFTFALFGSILYVIQGEFSSVIFHSIPIAILGGVLAILGIYLGTIAIIAFATTKEFKDAFDFKKVFAVALSPAFLLNAILGIFIYIIISAILAFIPYLGAAIGSFVAGVIVYTILGEVYGTN